MDLILGNYFLDSAKYIDSEPIFAVKSTMDLIFLDTYLVH